MTTRGMHAMRGYAAMLLLPLAMTGCSHNSTDPALVAPAPGEIARSVRGASTALDMTVEALASATEATFADMNIAMRERENEEDGIEFQGRDGDWEVEVEIDRDNNDPLTELEVSVHRGGVDFNAGRSVEILRAIMERASAGS